MGIVLGIKASVARAICHPAIGRAIGQLLRDHIPYRGCLIETTSRNVCPETKAALFWGIYESCELRFVQRYIRRDLDVVELGASIGGVTCHIRKRLGPDQRLLAVEANPELAALACRSLERNGLARNVSILKRAICYEGVRPSGSSWATVPSRGGPPIRLRRSGRVPGTPVPPSCPGRRQAEESTRCPPRSPPWTSWSARLAGSDLRRAPQIERTVPLRAGAARRRDTGYP